MHYLNSILINISLYTLTIRPNVRDVAGNVFCDWVLFMKSTFDAEKYPGLQTDA
jgi:hypothetical protein